MDDKPFNPYKYQQLFSQKFLEDKKNIVLQAPTGAGKTDASLLPGIDGFDICREQRGQLPEYPLRIIYSVPMRVLAQDFVDKYRKRAQAKRWEAHWHPTIQTGDSPKDELFEGHLIFATVDQTLANFLNIPYGLPGKLDNINAGAMIGSYLIFDEFHLYPNKQMMLTVLAMLKMLKDVSRFVLMSATFSPVFLHEIARILCAEVIADEPGTPISEGLFCDVTPVQTQRRTWFAEDGLLDAQAVQERIEDAKRVLCICNTVDRAQAVYRDLSRIYGTEDCRLLHSHFYRADRRKTEQFVQERFKEKGAQRTILVATQVVEVGLDISSDVLLTECAPAASLIQRAGRCARCEDEKGRVHVFQPPYDEERQKISYAPYIEDEQEDICEKTWEALISDEFNGRVMRFPEEQQLIEIAHGDADRALVANLKQRIDERIGEITDCMANRSAGYVSDLIRHQDSVPLYIDPDPNQNEFLSEKPWRREAISLSKGQIFHAMKQMQEMSVDEDHLFWGGMEQPDDDAETPGVRIIYKWIPLRDSGEVFSKDYWRFVAHPDAVSYSKSLGLILFPDDTPAEPSPDVKARAWEPIAYEAERYHEHIAGLYGAYTLPFNDDGKQRVALRDEILYPLRRLCQRFRLDPIQAEKLLRLTLALHDVGKLNQPWQAWAHDWQKYYQEGGYRPTLPIDDPDPLAHIDYDGNDSDQKQLSRNFKHRPRGRHAGESAEAVVEIVREAAGDDQDFWMPVVLGALMRHHSPDAKDARSFKLARGVENSFYEALRICRFEAQAGNWVGLLQTEFRMNGGEVAEAAQMITPHRNDYRAALMYFLFVRVLRLADQRAGKYWKRYRNTDRLIPQREEDNG